MSYDLDLIKGAIVLPAAMVSALYDCALDIAVGLAFAFVFHRILRPVIIFSFYHLLSDNYDTRPTRKKYKIHHDIFYKTA